MGIEEDIKEVVLRLQNIDKKIDEFIQQKAPTDRSEEKNNVSDKKDENAEKPEPKQEIDSDEPIFYECTNCGVSFIKGEEHNCKTEQKRGNISEDKK